MKSFFFALLCTLTLSAPALAQTSPQEFLSAILQHDFDGDGLFRIDKALFTDGRTETLDDPPDRREVFDARYDPIELVAKWEFAGAGKVTSREATLPVHFVVVAETVGYGGYPPAKRRRIEPIAAMHDVQVKYHLRRRGADWVLVNPPLPRVGLFAVIGVFRKEIQLDENTMKLESADPKGIEFQKKFRDFWVDQVNLLEDTARRMNLSPDTKPEEQR